MNMNTNGYATTIGHEQFIEYSYVFGCYSFYEICRYGGNLHVKDCHLGGSLVLLLRSIRGIRHDKVCHLWMLATES